MPSKVFPPTIPQKTLIVVPPVFLLLAAVTVGLRFWARTLKKQKWGLDDFLCLGALVINWAGYACLVLATVWGGYGVDQSLIPPANIPIVFKVLLGFSETWGTGITLIQLSILALYLRIFRIIRWFRYCCYILMVLVIVWWISFIVVIVTACVPLEKFWMPKLAGTCIDMPEFMRWNLSSHIVLDVLIIGIVLPVIWDMKTSMSNKLTVSVALGLAIFSTACAMTRFILVANEWKNPNATGRRYMGSLFQCLENAAGVICCSLPVMAFLIARVGDSRFGSGFRRLLSYGSRSNLSGSGASGSRNRSGSGSENGGGSRAHLNEEPDNGGHRPSQSSGHGSYNA